MINLVTVNPDNSIKINNLEVVANPKFKVILERNNPCKKDKYGTKKYLNILEMVYIVLYSEKYLGDNTFAALSNNDRKIALKQEIGLDEDWFPDEFVLSAISEYIRIQQKRNPTLSVLNSLEQGLMLNSKGIDTFNRSTITAITKVEEFEKILEQRDLTEEELALFGIYNTTIVENMVKVMDIGAKLPKALKAISELVQQVKKESGQAKFAKGNRAIGMFENPD